MNYVPFVAIPRWTMLGWLMLISVACVQTQAQTAAEKRLPNVIIVFADDQGYADLGCFGAEKFTTPNIDRLASEGMKFTDFYVAQAVCSASRTALLTGCYPNRVGIQGALGPSSKVGIHADEMLLPEVFKAKGYATAIYGKWHLGHHPQFLPMQHGFDDFFGLPYSNDMWPFHPTAKFPPLPLIDKDKIQEYNPDQTQLTTWYTEHAVKFIADHKDRPFFLYVPHSMPHVPLFVSEKYAGKTERGLYGDVISEIDWSVGQILAEVKKHGLDENTLVIYTSDNGPWMSYGDHGGSAKPLREGKGTTWEGGVRVPGLMRWPGKIPAGKVCREPCATIDILPTMAHLLNVPLSSDRKIDGLNIWPLMSGDPQGKSPHDALYFYWGHGLEAVRSGPWKLHFPHAYRSTEGQPAGQGGKPGPYIQKKTDLALYNLETDFSETTNVATEHPEVVAKLQALAEKAREDLGDSLTKRTGKNVRLPGKLSEE